MIHPDQEVQMPKGVIKFFNDGKGYGFIEAEDTPGHTEDVFVHHSHIEDNGYRTLKEGETVTFDVREGRRGPEAVNVQKLA
jgi:CspA family cold shock protein